MGEGDCTTDSANAIVRLTKKDGIPEDLDNDTDYMLPVTEGDMVRYEKFDVRGMYSGPGYEGGPLDNEYYGYELAQNGASLVDYQERGGVLARRYNWLEDVTNADEAVLARQTSNTAIEVYDKDKPVMWSKAKGNDLDTPDLPSIMLQVEDENNSLLEVGELGLYIYDGQDYSTQLVCNDCASSKLSNYLPNGFLNGYIPINSDWDGIGGYIKFSEEQSNYIIMDADLLYIIPDKPSLLGSGITDDEKYYYYYTSWWPEEGYDDPDLTDDGMLKFQVMPDPCVDTPDDHWCITIFTKSPGDDVYEHVCTLPEVEHANFVLYDANRCQYLNNSCDLDQNICSQNYFWRAVRNYVEIRDDVFLNTYRMFVVQRKNQSSDLQVYINDQYQFSNLSFAKPIYVEELGMKVELRYQSPSSGDPDLRWNNLKIIPEKGHNPDDL